MRRAKWQCAQKLVPVAGARGKLSSIPCLLRALLLFTRAQLLRDVCWLSGMFM